MLKGFPFSDKETIRISTIGGSLTAGDGSRCSKNGWNDNLVKTYFPSVFSGKTFELNDAGIGGTGSQYGLLRFTADVSPAEPDIVFIEFAVNDRTSSFDITKGNIAKRNIESLILQCKALPSNPYVVLLGLAVYDYKKTTGVLRAQKEVAEYYDIPFIDLEQYIVNECESVTSEQMAEYSSKHPEITDWDSKCNEAKGFCVAFTSTDGVHPTDDGYYKWYLEIVRQIDEMGDSFYRRPLNKEPIYSKDTPLKGLTNIVARDLGYIDYSSDWKFGETIPTSNGTNTEPICKGARVLATDKIGAKLKFKFKGNTLAFIGHRSVDLGMFRVTVDGDKDNSKIFTQTFASKLGFSNQNYYVYSLGELSEGLHEAEIENIENTSNITKDRNGIEIKKQNITAIGYICTNIY